jgi:hypothetical protein
MDPWTIGWTLVHSPWCTTDRNSDRSSPGFSCTRPHRDEARSKRRGRGSLPRLAQDGGGAQMAERQLTEVATVVP